MIAYYLLTLATLAYILIAWVIAALLIEGVDRIIEDYQLCRSLPVRKRWYLYSGLCIAGLFVIGNLLAETIIQLSPLL